MRKKRLKVMIMAILLFVIEPGFVHRAADAAGGTVTKSYTATSDTMELRGHIQYDGIHDNDGDGFLSIGRSNDEFGDVRQRAGVTFDLGVPEGNIVSAELVLTVATVIRNPSHTLYMEVRGSAANDLDHNFGGTFPSVDTNSPYADKFTAKSTAEVPMGTYLQNQSITFNVKSAVDAFTDSSDRRITFTLNGNEADAASGWFSIHSRETYVNAAYRPKLIVTYETGPVNTPPVGSFTIVEGAATSTNIVNLSVTGSDPDAGDSVTHMRFANNDASLSAASWLPFSNKATFSLTGGDGPKTIHMQLKDFNNGISANSSQTILLDQTGPTGTLIINHGATWTKTNTVTLTGTYADGGGSGVEQVRLSNISGSWQTSWLSINDLNGKSWVLPAGEGAKTVYVQYKDKVGNTSNATISSTITVDTIAPVISNVENGKVYNSKVNALFNEGSGLLNGNPYTSGTDITQDGTYTLIVTDTAGNVTTVSFKIDTVAPIVTGVTDGGVYQGKVTVGFNKGTATLNGTAFTSGTEIAQDGSYTLVVTDTAGNVITVRFKIDTGAPIVTGVTDGGVYQRKVTVGFNKGTATLNGTAFTSGTEIAQDGSYTLVATDAAGNITTIKFLIDTTAPTGTVIIHAGAKWTNVKDTILTLAGDDGIEGSGVVEMRFSSNGSDWGDWEPNAATKSWNLGAGDGEKTVFVQFKDKAGNVSGAVINDIIKLDQTIPTGTIVINGGSATTNSKSVTLSLTSSDGVGSGVVDMRFSADELTWSGWEKVSLTKSWNLAGDFGSKKLYVQYRDLAGNNSVASMAAIEYRADNSYVPPVSPPTNPVAPTEPEKPVNIEEPEKENRPEEPPHMEFTDLNGHWAAPFIEKLATKGIFNGYPDGTFRPQEMISRKHVAALLARALKPEAVRGTINFTDVPSTHPYANEIRQLQQAGIFDGDENGKFNPDEPITRAQMAKVLVLAFQLKGNGKSDFMDVSPTHWSKEYIDVLYENNITTGDNGLFKPNDSVTRAHLAVFLYRSLELLQES